MSRAQLTSTVEQNTGGAVAPFVAGKNFVINGAMEIAQRGTTYTPQGTWGYGSLDRWGFQAYPTTGGNANQSTSAPTGYKYSVKLGRTSSSTNTSALQMMQCIESANAILLQGQTVTISFYAKAGANFSGTSASSVINTGTGTDESLSYANGSYTGNTTFSNSFTPTTSWARYSFQIAIPSNATEASVVFAYTPVGTAGADDNLYITGVQLEQGKVATPFSRAGTTLQGELALCQRYYFQVNTATNDNALPVVREATTSGIVPLFLPVTMRTVPTVSSTTGTYGRLVGYDTSFSLTVVNLSAMSTRSNALNNNFIELGYTSASMAGTCVFVQWDVASNAGLLGLSAEL